MAILSAVLFEPGLPLGDSAAMILVVVAVRV
jgi:hypothetical protein